LSERVNKLFLDSNSKSPVVQTKQELLFAETLKVAADKQFSSHAQLDSRDTVSYSRTRAEKRSVSVTSQTVYESVVTSVVTPSVKTHVKSTSKS
jgi:hypothetical protein